MSTLDTREDKVFRFLSNQWTTRWCKAEACACMGCINRSYLSETRKKWYSIYPNEPFLREEDVTAFNENKLKSS